MLRSSFRRLRRTLSFKSRSKHRGGSKGGANQSNSWENDSVHIKQQGCSFPVKYLGCLEVSESRGTQVCSQAAHQMKMSSAGKKKQRVTLWITEDTLRVTDDHTKSLVVDQVIEKVSFCTPDPHDEKLFSYICRDGTSRRWLCHSFKGIKDTGERISHAVGCAFAACLAKKQQQNQNFQRGTSSRKTLEARANGVVLPKQSIDTLQKLNQEEYNDRVNKVNQALTVTPSIDQTPDSPTQTSPTSKQAPENAFARPRPSVGMDAAAFTRHASLPYRTKKSTTQSGSSTYQALTEDPLPPRIPSTSEPVVVHTQNDMWAQNDQNSLLMAVNQLPQANPFSTKPQSITIQQQSGFTHTVIQPTTEPTANPFSNNYVATPTTPNANPFSEKFV